MNKSMHQKFITSIKTLLTSFFIMVLFMMASSSGNAQTIIEPYYGVWANNDSELVQTEKYTILFERRNNKIYTTLRKNEQKDGEIYSNLISALVFDMNTKEYQKLDCDTIKKKLRFEDYMKLNNGYLNILNNSTPIKLELVEKIDICPPYEMPLANIGNIGECLQNWQLGTIVHSLDPENLHIEIGTNNHLYIYMISPNMIYCRAAQIKHNNKGSLFNQNIRIMFNANTKEATANMASDNLKKINKDIIIDDTLFDPNICIYTDNGIYWSLISYEPNMIKLNGCGDIYTFKRPAINNNNNIVEWFEYKY